MAINRPTIAAGPTTAKGIITDYPIRTHWAEPGGTYSENVDGTVVITTVDPPTAEGQVYFYMSQDGRNRSAVMYIGVNLSGTLTWVPADMSTYVNSYTGLPFDPMND